MPPKLTSFLEALKDFSLRPDIHDRRIWSLGSDGIYSVSSFFQGLSNPPNPGSFPIRKCGNHWPLLRFKVLFGKQCGEELSQQLVCKSRTLYMLCPPCACYLCLNGPMSTHHLFLRCSFISTLWKRGLVNLSWLSPQNIHQFIWQWDASHHRKKARPLCNLCLHGLI